MVPAHLIALDSFPLTQNGKIDRKALPGPGRDTQAGRRLCSARERDRSKTGGDLAGRAGSRAGRGQQTIFFEIGGHSLLAVRLVSAIRKTFGMELPIDDIFDYPTVALLATRLTADTSTGPVTAGSSGNIPAPNISLYRSARNGYGS